jgi:hypothetical protein
MNKFLRVIPVAILVLGILIAGFGATGAQDDQLVFSIAHQKRRFVSIFSRSKNVMRAMSSNYDLIISFNVSIVRSTR